MTEPTDERTEDRPRGAARREFFRRFRRPLIGLGMIGAAAPMGRFMEQPATARKASLDEGEDTEARRRAAQRTTEPVDVEENLAEQIGELRAAGERNLVVVNAIEKYGIPHDLAEDIYEVAEAEGVDPKLAYGLVNTESTFREGVTSYAGAVGLTQVMPRTARWLVPGTKKQDLFDRRTNLRLGFRYLDQLIDKYRGNLQLALTAYNRGPGTVDRVLSRGGDPDNGYAGRVLGD
jgi:soluble lytic murein transglycosylase-like protein